jgi:hypothetical protein
MQWLFRISFVTLLLMSACDRKSLDRKVVGEWQSGCSIDVCTITTLKADHSFSVRFDQKNSAESYSGAYSVEGDQLVAHVTAADKALQDIIGKDFRIVVADFHQDSFVAILVDDHRTSQLWKHLH